MKQTFKIPDGCKEITIEQVGNQIVTTFEPKKYTPKAGDCDFMLQKSLEFNTNNK